MNFEKGATSKKHSRNSFEAEQNIETSREPQRGAAPVQNGFYKGAEGYVAKAKLKIRN